MRMNNQDTSYVASLTISLMLAYKRLLQYIDEMLCEYGCVWVGGCLKDKKKQLETERTYST